MTRPPTKTNVAAAGLRLLAATGLAVDAYVHADLASAYTANGETITQGALFLIDAAVASAAALAVLLVARWYVAACAFAVAASALGAVLLYRYVDVGALGPLPNMYEPMWFPEKTTSAIAEAVTATAALPLIALLRLRARRKASSEPKRSTAPPSPRLLDLGQEGIRGGPGAGQEPGDLPGDLRAAEHRPGPAGLEQRPFGDLLERHLGGADGLGCGALGVG